VADALLHNLHTESYNSYWKSLRTKEKYVTHGTLTVTRPAVHTGAHTGTCVGQTEHRARSTHTNIHKYKHYLGAGHREAVRPLTRANNSSWHQEAWRGIAESNNRLWRQGRGLLLTDRRTDITSRLLTASFAFTGCRCKKTYAFVGIFNTFVAKQCNSTLHEAKNSISRSLMIGQKANSRPAFSDAHNQIQS